MSPEPEWSWHPTRVHVDGGSAFECVRCGTLVPDGEPRWSCHPASGRRLRRNSRWVTGKYCRRCAMNGKAVQRAPIPRKPLAPVVAIFSRVAGSVEVSGSTEGASE